MPTLQGTHCDKLPFAQKLTARSRDIVIDEPYLAEVDLAPLAELPKLRKLYVRARELRALDLTPLSATPIEELRLVLSDTCAVTLPANAPALRDVTMSGGPPALDLSPLASSPIDNLLLFQSVLAQIDLSPLARAPLEIIWLSNTALETLDLRPLAPLPTLRSINLAGSKLTSLTVEPGFPALQFLHLTGNPLTALDLGAFHSLATVMKVLNLPTSLQGVLDVPRRKGLEIAYSLAR